MYAKVSITEKKKMIQVSDL